MQLGWGSTSLRISVETAAVPPLSFRRPVGKTNTARKEGLCFKIKAPPV